ncbi:MAG: Lrp/AsnC family transcriptional regulator [Gemmatimonadota bacterium]
MDEMDRKILALLQENARISNAEIARQVGLASSAIFHRIRKLEEGGVIRGYHTQLDPRLMGMGMAAFVRVQTGDGASAEAIVSDLLALPEVQEVHRVVGEDCFFVKVRTRDPQDLARLLDDSIQPIQGVATTRTTVVLTTARESLAVPVDRPFGN